MEVLFLGENTNCKKEKSKEHLAVFLTLLPSTSLSQQCQPGERERLVLGVWSPGGGCLLLKVSVCVVE